MHHNNNPYNKNFNKNFKKNFKYNIQGNSTFRIEELNLNEDQKKTRESIAENYTTGITSRYILWATYKKFGGTGDKFARLEIYKIFKLDSGEVWKERKEYKRSDLVLRTKFIGKKEEFQHQNGQNTQNSQNQKTKEIFDADNPLLSENLEVPEN